MLEINTLHELLVDELRDIYHAEKQITKALPKMIKKATSPNLKAAFEKHLGETEGQIERLEKCFELLEEKARAKPCAAMQGIIEEATEEMGEDMTDEVMDAILVACAQKVEHYEIASYGSVVAWATGLGLSEVAGLLAETLDEEKATDEALTELADDEINPAALSGEAGEADDADDDSVDDDDLDDDDEDDDDDDEDEDSDDEEEDEDAEDKKSSTKKTDAKKAPAKAAPAARKRN